MLTPAHPKYRFFIISVSEAVEGPKCESVPGNWFIYRPNTIDSLFGDFVVIWWIFEIFDFLCTKIMPPHRKTHICALEPF